MPVPAIESGSPITVKIIPPAEPKGFTPKIKEPLELPMQHLIINMDYTLCQPDTVLAITKIMSYCERLGFNLVKGGLF